MTTADEALVRLLYKKLREVRCLRRVPGARRRASGEAGFSGANGPVGADG